LRRNRVVEGRDRLGFAFVQILETTDGDEKLDDMSQFALIKSPSRHVYVDGISS
jgi:hypothetical protein